MEQHIHKTVREEIENATEERKRVIYSIREFLWKRNWTYNSANFVFVGRLLSNSPSFGDNIDYVINELHDFTEDEHFQFWSFILEQTDNLKDV